MNFTRYQQWIRSPQAHIGSDELQSHQSHGTGYSKAEAAGSTDDSRYCRTAHSSSTANESKSRDNENCTASCAANTASTDQLQQQTTSDSCSLSIITATLAEPAR